MKLYQRAFVSTLLSILTFSTSLLSSCQVRRFPPRSPFSLLQRHYATSRNNDDSNHDVKEEQPIITLNSASSLRLPLFPLRKRVRFPTDQLTLNLYEDRYLQMSEYILFHQQKQQQQQQQRKLQQSSNISVPIFGVIYSSDKPQLIAKGSDPIVPMLDPGDVGVICVVLDWMDGMVPTGMSLSSIRSETPSLRRRIRLNAIAVGRFSIERIVHDGTGCSSSTTKNNDDDYDHPDDDDGDGEVREMLPFILADTKVLIDDYTLDVVDKDLIGAVEDELRKIFNNDDRSFIESSSDEAGDPATLTRPEMSSRGSLSPTELVDLVTSIVQYCDDDNFNHDINRQSQQRNELISFLAASALSKVTPSLASPRTMSTLLKLQSTEKRFHRLLDR